MKINITRNNSRGFFDYDWLKTFHTFSFSSYFNTNRMNFGKLRVLNDDTISPAKGFGLHPHENMEIITIPLSGELRHHDNGGHSQVIKTGDVQVMSAGTGIWHSEFNNSESEDVSLLQIWIFPKVVDVEPRYDQKTYDIKDRKNKLQLLVSPEQSNGNLWINQDAWLSLTELDSGKSINYNNHKSGNGIFVFAIDGEVYIDGESIGKRDSIELQGVDETSIKAVKDSEVLIIEVPL